MSAQAVSYELWPLGRSELTFPTAPSPTTTPIAHIHWRLERVDGTRDDTLWMGEAESTGLEDHD